MIDHSSILYMLEISDRLKSVARNSWTTTGKRESVADHSWALSMLVMFFSDFSEHDLDKVKCLELAIVHDLAEAITGDIPYFNTESSDARERKRVMEENAMHQICDHLPCNLAEKVFLLWEEYNQGISKEAKFVKALDKIEGQAQKNFSPCESWCEKEKADAGVRLNSFCEFDQFLVKLMEKVQLQSKQKFLTSKL